MRRVIAAEKSGEHVSEIGRAGGDESTAREVQRDLAVAGVAILARRVAVVDVKGARRVLVTSYP